MHLSYAKTTIKNCPVSFKDHLTFATSGTQRYSDTRNHPGREMHLLPFKMPRTTSPGAGRVIFA